MHIYSILAVSGFMLSLEPAVRQGFVIYFNDIQQRAGRKG